MCNDDVDMKISENDRFLSYLHNFLLTKYIKPRPSLKLSSFDNDKFDKGNNSLTKQCSGSIKFMSTFNVNASEQTQLSIASIVQSKKCVSWFRYKAGQGK